MKLELPPISIVHLGMATLTFYFPSNLQAPSPCPEGKREGENSGQATNFPQAPVAFLNPMDPEWTCVAPLPTPLAANAEPSS